jgi:hypothetical protein
MSDAGMIRREKEKRMMVVELWEMLQPLSGLACK